MSPISDKLRNILPNQGDDPDTRHFKTIIYLSVGIIILMVIAAVVTFFMTINSAEQTMVPDLKGKELANALVELQDRGLYPRVQLRYSSNPSDKGTVLGQDPSSGTMMKAGREVTLQVSRGAVIDRVENYIGWKLSDLELHLQTLSTTYGPLLQLQKPVTSVFDNSPAGTIIQQQPSPGTPLTGLTQLTVVVSLGPHSASIEVPDLVKKTYTDAMNELAKANIPFAFTDRKAGGNEKPGTVVSQSPDAKSNVPKNTLISLVMTDPANVPKGEVFGMLQKNLPNYPVAI
ncbi:MAG TPA: PASTA domain-containing protein, partial [Spirochaetia bacterium]|nr:PASTA domain-containing protein [Spirochaetia bacterium]